MLLILAVIIFVLWLAGLVFGMMGNLIHVLLVVAIIVLIVHFATGGQLSLG